MRPRILYFILYLVFQLIKNWKMRSRVKYYPTASYTTRLEFRFLIYCHYFSFLSKVILQNDFEPQKRGGVYFLVLKIQIFLKVTFSVVSLEF